MSHRVAWFELVAAVDDDGRLTVEPTLLAERANLNIDLLRTAVAKFEEVGLLVRRDGVLVEPISAGDAVRRAGVRRRSGRYRDARRPPVQGDQAGDNTDVVAVWRVLWRERYPAGVLTVDIDAASELRKAAAVYGLDELRRRMDRFLDDDSPHLERDQHPLTRFVAVMHARYRSESA